MSNSKKQTIGYYLKNNIIKPYLIHVEFELENVIMKLKTDKMLSKLINLQDIDLMKVNDYITSIEITLITIRKLIRIHQID